MGRRRDGYIVSVDMISLQRSKTQMKKCCQRKRGVTIGRHFFKAKRGRYVGATVARNSSIARSGVPAVTPTWSQVKLHIRVLCDGRRLHSTIRQQSQAVLTVRGEDGQWLQKISADDNLRARSTREDESWPVEHSQWLSGQTLDLEWASEHIPVAHATVKPVRRQSFIFHIPIHNKNFPNNNKVKTWLWASKQKNQLLLWLLSTGLHLTPFSFIVQARAIDRLPPTTGSRAIDSSESDSKWWD